MPSIPPDSSTDSSRAARLDGILCAIIAVMLFASFTLVSRLGLTTTRLTLPDLAMLRFAIAGLVLFPVFIKHRLERLRRSQAFLLAVTGGLGFVLFAYAGFRLAPASHGAVLLHGTIPLFTFLLTWFVAKRPTPGARRGGLVLIMLGICAMAWDSVHTAATWQWLGDGALLLASLCWSAYGVVAQRSTAAPMQAAAIVAMGSLVCFLPVYLMLPSSGMAAVGWRDLLLQGVFQGILLGVVSIVVYTRAVVSLGAQRTAVFTAAVPCVTVIAGLWLLGEYPSWAALSGVAAVTAGMLTAMRNP